MPLKLIRLSGSLADESFPVIRLFHVFFQNRKLYRSDVQNPAVKFFQVEIISKSFLTDCFQVKEIQISPKVFQIVTGSFNDILMKSPPPCGDITPMEVVSNSRAEPQS